MVKITATGQNIEKRMKTMKTRLRGLWDNMKHTSVCIIGVPEGEEREKGPEKTFAEIIAENYPNVEKEIVNQVQKVQSPRQDKFKEEHNETHT